MNVFVCLFGYRGCVAVRVHVCVCASVAVCAGVRVCVCVWGG